MSDSETEPESDIFSSLSPTAQISNTLDHLVNTPGTSSSESDPISAVDSAIKVLESLDFSLVRKVVSSSKSIHVVLKLKQDASLHGVIQESSATLLGFLHIVLTMSSTSAQDVRRAMESLALICRRLLVYRLSLLMVGLFSSATVVLKFVVPISAYVPRHSHSGAPKSRTCSHRDILGGRHSCKAWRCDFMCCQRHA